MISELYTKGKRWIAFYKGEQGIFEIQENDNNSENQITSQW
jgi:hypothetical protein